MKSDKSPRRPSERDCRIYQRHVLEGETQEVVAADCKLTRQRVAQIAVNVERWIGAHPEHPLAGSMRVRCTRRWESLWAETMAGFQRSRENRQVTIERSTSAAAGGGASSDGPAGAEVVVRERTVRQHCGDVRFLNVALRVNDRQQRLWPREAAAAPGENGDRDSSPNEGLGGAAVRFPFLPAALCELADLARGVAADPKANASVLFEERCADAFRSLGFTVKEFGQGCGRAADCLALAPSERFGVVLDAKMRRGGYTLGTDDRQFCEYAARHSRELAQSGIDRVYFAVVGSGFRQHDLDNLARFMADAPIRSVCFWEVHALMKIVNDSIHERAGFRLAEIDRLLFGNKIIDR